MGKVKKKNMTVQRSLFFKRLRIDLRDNWTIYLMVLIPLVWLIVFCYVPMSGIQLAFKTFKAKLGIWGSPWIGFKNFERFFKSYSFGTILWNTISINVYSLVVGFPIPIVFALFLNYLRHRRLKKTVQMVSYAPYFISTVVMCGMIIIFLDKDTGAVNQLLRLLGLDGVNFMGTPAYFKDIYVWTSVWQGMGWSSIIYISALAGVDYQLHEAAIVDGAGRIQTLFQIVMPLVKSGMVAVGIYAFLMTWDDYLHASTLIQTDSLRTLSAGVALRYLGELSYDWSLINTISIVGTLPMIFLFFFFRPKPLFR